MRAVGPGLAVVLHPRADAGGPVIAVRARTRDLIDRGAGVVDDVAALVELVPAARQRQIDVTRVGGIERAVQCQRIAVGIQVAAIVVDVGVGVAETERGAHDRAVGEAVVQTGSDTARIVVEAGLARGRILVAELQVAVDEEAQPREAGVGTGGTAERAAIVQRREVRTADAGAQRREPSTDVPELGVADVYAHAALGGGLFRRQLQQCRADDGVRGTQGQPGQLGTARLQVAAQRNVRAGGTDDGNHSAQCGRLGCLLHAGGVAVKPVGEQLRSGLARYPGDKRKAAQRRGGGRADQRAV